MRAYDVCVRDDSVLLLCMLYVMLRTEVSAAARGERREGEHPEAKQLDYGAPARVWGTLSCICESHPTHPRDLSLRHV